MSQAVMKPWATGSPPADITFINASLVDVEEGKTHPNTSIRISDGMIRAVEVNAHTQFQGSSTVIDLKNKFICPGLIDCHVHLTATPGAATLKDLYSAAPTTVALRTAYVARQMLLRGFTTVRDTGGADAALRDSIAEGLIPGPRVYIAGRALSQTGGHGDFRDSYQGNEHKCCGGHCPSLARVCDGVPRCLEAVRDELRKGADFIKIMCGGGVATPSDPLDMLQFTSDEIRAVTSTAKYRNTYVTAHAYTPAAIRHAVDNGCLGIEHGNFIDLETAKYCREKGITVTPTLVVYQGYTKAPFGNYLDEVSASKNRQVLASGLESLKILKEAGVTTCHGSDLLGGLHVLQNEEFSIRASVLNSLDILRSATINGAMSEWKANSAS